MARASSSWSFFKRFSMRRPWNSTSLCFKVVRNISWPMSRLVRAITEDARMFYSSVVVGKGDCVGVGEGSGASEGLLESVGSFKCCGVECCERRIGGTL